MVSRSSWRGAVTKLISLGPRFAAELRGVDLIDVATNDAAYCAVREAFEEHSVILFRNQDISDDVQIAFSRAFGPLERTKVGSRCAGTLYVHITNVAADATLVAEPTARRSLTRRTSSGIPTVRSRRLRRWHRFCRRGRSLRLAGRRSSSRPGSHGTGCPTTEGRTSRSCRCAQLCHLSGPDRPCAHDAGRARRVATRTLAVDLA